MLSTRFGYGRPAFFAARLAEAFAAGDKCFDRPVFFFGLARFHGAFNVATADGYNSTFACCFWSSSFGVSPLM